MGKYTHLSTTDRRRFHIFLEMGLPVIEIAKRLSRHKSTLYRELSRNQEEGVYSHGIAQEKTETRAQEKRPTKLERDGVIRDYVIRSLKKGWSPEQISGRMKHQPVALMGAQRTSRFYSTNLKF